MVGGAEGSFIGPIHRIAIRMDGLADLVAGSFSRSAENNAASGKALRLDPKRVYKDWKALIAAEKGKIDFLVICTTNESHYAIAKAALEAGLDVFCEKPLSLTLKEAEDIARTARRLKRVLGVPFTYTGYPMVKFARDFVKRGGLGRVDKVVMEYVQGSFRKPDRRKTWKMDPTIAGPRCVVSDIGVHAFTLIEYVTGLKIKTLLADLSSYANGTGLDDDASVLMRFDDPEAEAGRVPKASLVTSKIATGEENGVRLRVYGNKASLHWDQESPNYITVKYPAKPDETYSRNSACVNAVSRLAARASRFPAGHHEGFVEALANIYDEFVEAVATRQERDFPGVEEGVRSMKFVEACLKSAKRGSKWTML